MDHEQRMIPPPRVPPIPPPRIPAVPHGGDGAATRVSVPRQPPTPPPDLGQLKGYHMTDEAARLLRVHPVLLRWAMHVTRVRRFACGKNQKLIDDAGLKVVDDWIRQHDPRGQFRTRGTRPREKAGAAS